MPEEAKMLHQNSFTRQQGTHALTTGNWENVYMEGVTPLGDLGIHYSSEFLQFAWIETKSRDGNWYQPSKAEKWLTFLTSQRNNPVAALPVEGGIHFNLQFRTDNRAEQERIVDFIRRHADVEVSHHTLLGCSFTIYN
ncbi:hypothetical protein KC573_01510 [candidate division WWE3 bacterium]|uniref:Uncharacterized protein n=1 Tax=candidate division WWE3 bacterium TaxID=2053526 RepID=A0A955RX52_UNCKA|nr:hypothetical protein [candidate division WWE3 bacterium]